MFGRSTALFFAWVAPSMPSPPLAWAAERVEYVAQAGETGTTVHFHFKNVSPSTVTISGVTASCGCTVAKIPREPWLLAPGEEGEITATVDFRGKFGTLEKMLYVRMPQMTKVLSIRLRLPPRKAGPARAGNQALGEVRRQAVFKGSCASCHADPLKGKTGSALYAAACEICHQPRGRASMMPNLAGLPKATDEFWRQWIGSGRAGTLMPAFSRDQGGPLTSDQIDSLVQWLQRRT